MLPSELAEHQTICLTNTPDGETGPAILFTNEYAQREVWLIHLPDPRQNNPECSIQEEETYIAKQMLLDLPEDSHDDFFTSLIVGGARIIT